MRRFRSYRQKLQTAFVALGLTAIFATGWEASMGASSALRAATYDRLNAIRETRVRELDRYFRDVTNHVLALASDESTIVALEEFRDGWRALPETRPGSPREAALRDYYSREYAPRIAHEPGAAPLDRWIPEDPRVRTLQFLYIAGNPHPVRSKDLLLNVPEAGRYGAAHARFHPTLHRYQTAFGFYDIFLIGADDGRILYTVFKETDLGMRLTAPPYRDTSLARAFRRAQKLGPGDETVLEDFAPYAASYFAPAAFVAVPVWRAGGMIGVLAVQLSIGEVNRVMIGSGDRGREGLGQTGHAYLVGGDGMLRSDLRLEVEHPDDYAAQLKKAGASAASLDRVRRFGTAVLNVHIGDAIAASVAGAPASTAEGVDFRGVPVLRSHSPLDSPKLGWSIVAEIESAEAFAPVKSLQWRILGLGLIVAFVFLAAARWLAASVTRPVLALAAGARKLGGGEFGTRVAVETADEIGQLAESFNRMAGDLERTTVSKKELEALAGRLITAQEQERSRIARELHDDVTQRMAAAAIEAGRLARLDGVDAMRAGVERIRADLARLSDDIHSLSWRLHPATLEDLGLVAAIESECRGFFERGGPPVEFETGDLPEVLPREPTLALFRIVQEGLRNIERHAGANEVRIALGRANGELHLEIRDDGRGFDRNAPGWRAGLGLASMEERVRLLGGRIAVSSRPGAGSTISVTVPLENHDGQTESAAG